ncbi:MAG: ParB/RepB/Spo0J family partition protein [Ignavibacteria bacterium]|nr:ParB/RepB/Spo0J family partition protein [Bacteroidota bacterium]MSQ46036.1 ParB/RepB/Spo0J family partition protein [Ignavibacteria bacterium]
MAEQKHRNVLGRGLGALLPKLHGTDPISGIPQGKESAGLNSISLIDIVKIKPNPFQPRIDFEPKALDELRESIKKHGVIQPITVCRVGEGYELISGERRLRASSEAGLKKIPTYIISVNSKVDILGLALIENLQREDLNPIETAVSYKRLIEECNLTQEQLGDVLSKERSTITNFLRLLKLPDNIMQAVRNGALTMGHARALLSFTNPKQQQLIFKKIIDQGLPVRSVELIAKSELKRASKENKKTTAASSHHSVQSVESKLREKLGTKVLIKQKTNTSGDILIEYYSLDDLERIIELIQQGI